MSTRHKHGFTLIEVIGATAAFLIAFLSGTAAFTRLLHHEMANYNRTLAGIHAIGGAAAFQGRPVRFFQIGTKYYFGDVSEGANATFLGGYP